MERTQGIDGANLEGVVRSFLTAYRVPRAIAEQRRMRDLCSALPEIKREVEAALMQLEHGIIHLVLVSHVVNQTTGGKCSDTKLN